MAWNTRQDVFDALLRRVAGVLNRRPNSQEQQFVATTLQTLDVAEYAELEPQAILNTLARTISRKIISVVPVPQVSAAAIQNPTTTQTQSIRDYLTGLITIDSDVVQTDPGDGYSDDVSPAPRVNIKSILGLTNIGQVQRSLNSAARLVYNYVVFDTQNRAVGLGDGISQFGWRFVNENDATEGTIALKGYAENLKSMQIYQPIMAQPAVDTPAASGRISILIGEFYAQSFIATGNRRYHFLTRPRFNADVHNRNSNLFVELEINEFQDGKFEFDPPQTTFDTLTVSFGDPSDLVIFPADRKQGAFEYDFTGTEMRITFLPAGEQVGPVDPEAAILISIPEFTTDDPIADRELIAVLTDPRGVICTRVLNVITFPFSTATVAPQIGTDFVVRFLDVRSVFMMELAFEVY